MKILPILFLFIVSTIFAQEPVIYNLGDFTSVKVFSGLNVQLIKAKKSSIEISGNNADDVIVKNVNGTLKISVKLTETFSSKNFKVKVYYAKDLSVIDGNEGCVIKSEDVIKQNNVEVRAQEGSFIELALNTDKTIVKSDSGSQIMLTGTSKDQDITVNTGSGFKGFDLVGENITANATTGGEAKVYTKNVLNASVKLGGSILYKGKPSTVNSKTLLGGSIISAE